MDSFIFAVALFLSLHAVITNINLTVSSVMRNGVRVNQVLMPTIFDVLACTAWGVYHYLGH